MCRHTAGQGCCKGRRTSRKVKAGTEEVVWLLHQWQPDTALSSNTACTQSKYTQIALRETAFFQI